MTDRTSLMSKGSLISPLFVRFFAPFFDGQSLLSTPEYESRRRSFGNVIGGVARPLKEIQLHRLPSPTNRRLPHWELLCIYRPSDSDVEPSGLGVGEGTTIN